MRKSRILCLIVATITLTVPNAASAQEASDVVCDGCVGSRDILNGGVKTRDIGQGAVTHAKIHSGAVNWQKLALDLQQRILDLEAKVASLEDLVENNTVLGLDGYLELDTTDAARPTAVFTGVNVQVLNGLGATDTVNGLGNVIVGYSESWAELYGDYPICSLGEYDEQTECEANDGVWAADHNSGSHNVIIGPHHRYSRHSGLVAGEANTITGWASSVLGGELNSAHGYHSTVSGGTGHFALGGASTVSGGYNNSAIGWRSSVSGGQHNEARGEASAVNGGLINFAEGEFSTISGGSGNVTRGRMSTIGGGYDRSTDVDGTYNWRAGSLLEEG